MTSAVDPLPQTLVLVRSAQAERDDQEGEADGISGPQGYVNLVSRSDTGSACTKTWHKRFLQQSRWVHNRLKDLDRPLRLQLLAP